jgi:hypothetical protein
MNVNSSALPRRDSKDIIWLFFGGSFVGIMLIATAAQVHNRWVEIPLVIWGFGALGLAYQRHKRQSLTIGAVGALIGAIVLYGYEAGKGLAILATAGIYDSNHASRIYFCVESYLILTIVWLLFGVPHRAFKYQLDLDGKGSARRVLVRVLVTVTTILTGAYILLLHFGGGPLRGVGMRALIPGIIFTVFLVAPAYRSIMKACWRYGIGSLFSPKPLIEGWDAALTELTMTFDQAAIRARDRMRREKSLESKSASPDGSRASIPESQPRGGRASPQPSSKGQPSEKSGKNTVRSPASGQGRRGGKASQVRISKWPPP